MKTQIKIILLLLTATFLSHSCMDLDLLDDPNALTADQADVTMILNGAQIGYINMVAGQINQNNTGLNDASMEMMRMMNQFGGYTGPFSNARAARLGFIWETAYSEVLLACDNVIAQTEGDPATNVHLGIAKAIKGFTLAMLVDYFRDVPYTEALRGEEGIYSPILDDGADVYAAALASIDGAIVAFNAGEPASIPNDYYFDANRTQWVKACNTFKLKMYVQQQLIHDYSAEIAAIVNSGDFIDDAADNWVFQYSTVAAGPDSRHPQYGNNYTVAGGNDYMANDLMEFMKDSKTVWDPRMRYYFYRQILETPTGDQLPCEGSAQHPICYIGDYYWGRDHADDDGVPPDGLSRTLIGVYPAGGAFDADNFVPGSQNTTTNKLGAGIFPLWLSSWSAFVGAEVQLSDNFATGDTDARDLFEEGIRESIAYVMNFGAAQAVAAFVPDQAHIDTYVAEALANYDAAGTNAEKLDIVMQEFRIALYGNGVEAFNTYRRSGLPSNLQAPIQVAGDFPHSWNYPNTAVERNINIDPVVVTERVFWDDGSITLN